MELLVPTRLPSLVPSVGGGGRPSLPRQPYAQDIARWPDMAHSELGSRAVTLTLPEESKGSEERGQTQSHPPRHQLPFSPMSPLPFLEAQLQVLSARRPWPDPGPKLPGFELASGCSRWADRKGYSVLFIYLEPHHRNLLVPKNCLLTLSSQGAAVSISTITISFACWNFLVPTEWPFFR